MNLDLIFSLVAKVFNERNIGHANIGTNTALLGDAIANSGSPEEVFLAAASSMMAIIDFLDSTAYTRIAIGTVNVAQLANHIEEIKRNVQNNEPIAPATKYGVATNITGILAEVGAQITVRYPPLAPVVAALRATNVVLNFISGIAADTQTYIAQLEQRQRAIIGTFDTQVSDRAEQVTNVFENQLARDAAILGISIEELRQNSGANFTSEIDDRVQIFRDDINAQIEASLQLRVDLSVEELEIYKDQMLGQYNWITGNYGDDSSVSGTLSVLLGNNLYKVRKKGLETLNADFQQEFGEQDQIVEDFTQKVIDDLTYLKDAGAILNHALAGLTSALGDDRTGALAQLQQAYSALLAEMNSRPYSEQIDADYLTEFKQQFDTIQNTYKISANHISNNKYQDIVVVIADVYLTEQKQHVETFLGEHATPFNDAVRAIFALLGNLSAELVPANLQQQVNELISSYFDTILQHRTGAMTTLESYREAYGVIANLARNTANYLDSWQRTVSDYHDQAMQQLADVLALLEGLADDDGDGDGDGTGDGDGSGDDDEDGDGSGDGSGEDGGQAGDGTSGGVGGGAGELAGKGSQGSDRSIPVRDPLILDLGGDGFEFIGLNESNAYFDLTGNGFATRTAWLNASDAFLVFDRNSDGVINNISELFGSPERSGFDELSDLDSNGDGVIDVADEFFALLQVWQDLNGDGISQASELKTLAQIGIQSISLSFSPVTGANGDAQLVRTGTFKWSDGREGVAAETSGIVGEVLFGTNPTFSRFVGQVNIDPLVNAFGNIKGYGLMPDLHIAMSLNADFKEFMFELYSDLSIEFLTQNIGNILTQWAGVENIAIHDIDPNSRLTVNGTTGKVDFRRAGESFTLQELGIIKKYTGIDVLALGDGQWWENNQLVTTGGFYRQAYDEISRNLLVKFVVANGLLGEVMPELSYNSASDALYFPDDITAEFFNTVSNSYFSTAEHTAEGLFALFALTEIEPAFRDVLRNLFVGSVDLANSSRELASVANLLFDLDLTIGSDLTDLITGTSSKDTIYGYGGDDVMDTGVGTGDVAYGGDGNDTITSSGASARLYGEAGNDTLTASAYGSLLDGGDGDDVLKVYNSNSNNAYRYTNTLIGGQGNDR
ncbi:MAG TPA: hypothetical protein VGE87_03335, partial [Rheinheimera pacifica]